MKKGMEKIRGKRGIFEDYMGWVILAVALLALALVGYFILKGKGIGAIEFIKNIFRFGS